MNYTKKAQAKARNFTLQLQQLRVAYFKQLAVGRFKWKNLPLHIDSIVLENMLYNHGVLYAWMNHTAGRLDFLPGNEVGRLNDYGEHTSINIVGLGGEVTKTGVPLKSVVKIRNNPCEMNTRVYAESYAEISTDITQSIIVNARAQKTPVAIKTSKNNLSTAITAYESVDGNAPVFVSDGLDRETTRFSMEAINTEAPYRGKDLMELKHDFENEYYTLLGINNANTDKKERQIVDEVNSNNELIEASVKNMLECRQTACEEINKKWGTDISVRLHNLTVADGGGSLTDVTRLLDVVTQANEV